MKIHRNDPESKFNNPEQARKQAEMAADIIDDVLSNRSPVVTPEKVARFGLCDRGIIVFTRAGEQIGIEYPAEQEQP